MKLLNSKVDMEWIAALSGIDVSKFKSYTIRGNEDCPSELAFYESKNPNLTDRCVRYVYNSEKDLYEKVLD